MVSDSRLTIRSALAALLLSNLVTAEPLRHYGRDDTGVASPAAGPSTPISSGVVAPPGNVSSTSGGDDSTLPPSMQSNSSSSSASSSQPGASSADAGTMLLCGSQYYSEDKV
jgi:hypothetical protein